MINKEDITDCYLFLRKYNQSIPDETLDFILKSSLEKLRSIDGVKEFAAPPPNLPPRR